MKHSNLWIALSLLQSPALVTAQPVVRDAAVSIYAEVRDPVSMAFGADGALYCGRDASGSGGGTGDAVKIHRIAPGGGVATEFGNLAVSDPDAVIVDVVGVISGTPGAVLAGGVDNNSASLGKIVKIVPDGTVTTLFGPNSALYNPTDFVFDQDGRLLITEINNGKVLATSGGSPAVLFSLTQASRIAVDALGRIVVDSGNSTSLRLYSSSGVLSNANFATVRSSSPLARGPGGPWGTDVYAISPGGDLMRIAPDGATTKAGSGFSNVDDLAFGPDNALYAAEFSNDRIFRFAPPEVPGANTTVYARVTDPVRLSFTPDGTLFVGRDNTGSGGGHSDAVKIHRVGAGGSPVQEYGNSAITDPDGVFYDATGQFSGVQGAVLVAGEELNSSLGKIVRILPDGTVQTVFGPTSFAFNPNLMVLDPFGGRLLISDDVGNAIWAMTNSTPVRLINLAGAFPLEVDALGCIIAGTSDTKLRRYSSTGVLLNETFAQAMPNTCVARGPGGAWGNSIYFLGTNYNLMRVDTAGVVTEAGKTFGGIAAMAFGPDGALYLSHLESDLIWRVDPTASVPRLTATAAGPGAVQISWSPALEGFILQENAGLSADGWSDAASAAINPVTVPLDGPARLYRLIKR